MAGPGARLVENTGPISVCGEAQSLDSLECAIVVTLHTNTQPAASQQITSSKCSYIVVLSLLFGIKYVDC